MKILIPVCLFLSLISSCPLFSQYLNLSDTSAMLSKYLRKLDTASLSNRINLAATRTLQQVTDAGSTTTHNITASSFSVNNLSLTNVGAGLNSTASLSLTNAVAALNNQNIQTAIRNNVEGGGGSSQFFIRHNNYDSVNGYNVFDYTMAGSNSSLTIGSPSTMGFRTAGNFRMYFAYNGNVGINTTTPAQPLHVVGNTAFTGGNVMVNTTVDNGYTFQVNGTANINGNLAIGTVAVSNASDKLMVNGTIRAKKIITTSQGWADYVFDSSYKLPCLQEVAAYIRVNKHLPGMPGAAQIEKEGLDIGTIIKLQQAKIEELTLFMIEEDKKQRELELQLTALLERLKKAN